MSDYSKGDRVRFDGRIWHVTKVQRWGWGIYQLMDLLDPDTGEEIFDARPQDVEPVGFRVIQGGTFPRLVAVDGVRVA